jgi:hypothetical protein
MPVWLIEYFGARDLDNSFIFIALMTSPVWIGMVFFAKSKWIRQVARPYVVAPIYCLVLFVLVWKAVDTSLLPDPIVTATYGSARAFSDHPMAFLVLFCNFQILNLFLGTMIYQKSLKGGFQAPVELLLCCFLGAFALLPFSIRLLVRRQPLL